MLGMLEQEKLWCYQFATKLPKGEFKKLTSCVIDFDKDATWVVLLENAGAYSPE